MSFLTTILLVITIAISISQLGVIVFFLNFIKKNELADGAVKEAKEKSHAVITQAIQNAQEVVKTAEEAQLQKVAEQSSVLSALTKKFEENVTKLEEKTESSIASTAQQATSGITEAAETAEKQYEAVIQTAQKELSELAEQDKKLLLEKSEDLIAKQAATFQAFMEDVSKKIRSQVEAELAEERKAAEAYKEERVEAINEKVIDILEEVLLQTLGRKLSLKDEGEFVFQALEQAKKEHAFS